MPSTVEVEKAHKRLYERIPRFECQPGCTDCCGPVPFSKWEWDQVEDKRTATGVSCPYSQNGKCDIYAQRPLMCRLYGTVKGELECPHGCRPEKFLSPEEAREIVGSYIQIYTDHDRR